MIPVLITLLALCAMQSHNSSGVTIVLVQPATNGSYKELSHKGKVTIMSQSKTKRPIINDDLPFRSTYSPRLRLQLSFPENSPFTKQEFKDEADINVLMARYQSTGELPNLNTAAPQYLDATGFDYATNMQQIAEANSLFAELPSKIRNRFDNDPGKFLAFCGDPDNRTELADMGLLRDPLEWVDTEAAENYLNRSRANYNSSNPEPKPAPNTPPATEEK